MVVKPDTTENVVLMVTEDPFGTVREKLYTQQTGPVATSSGRETEYLTGTPQIEGRATANDVGVQSNNDDNLEQKHDYASHDVMSSTGNPGVPKVTMMTDAAKRAAANNSSKKSADSKMKKS